MAIGGHHNPIPKSEVWLTPPYILAALGPFELDPCAAIENPTWAAPSYYTEAEDGLSKPWAGRVWLNPPYTATKIGWWMKRMAHHHYGTALIFARTETAMFFEHVWRAASAVLFFEGRINFHFPNGQRAAANAGAPSCLVAYGDRDREILRTAAVPGQFIDLRRE